MNELERKQKQVCKILQMPISCKKEYSSIECKEDKILSGQKYIQTADEDMSDFAVGFYEIVYKDILNRKPILKENNDLFNTEFAGDTMNSFGRIANRTPGAGKSKKKRTSEEYWPESLVVFHKQYHCLANFWLLPMEIGRTSSKWSKAQKAWDYMDRFLMVYKENQIIYKKMYPTFFSMFDRPEDFAKRNFLLGEGEYLNEEMEIDMYSDAKQYESHTVIKCMQNKIEGRARCIAESEYVTELWEYFNDLNFFA